MDDKMIAIQLREELSATANCLGAKLNLRVTGVSCVSGVRGG